VTAHGVSDGELRRRWGRCSTAAREYDRGRAGYPPELIEAAMKRGVLSAGDPVVPASRVHGRAYARAIDAGSTPSRRVIVTLASSAEVAVPRYTPLIGGTSG
jgi:hypothetical protein